MRVAEPSVLWADAKRLTNRIEPGPRRVAEDVPKFGWRLTMRRTDRPTGVCLAPSDDVADRRDGPQSFMLEVNLEIREHGSSGTLVATFAKPADGTFTFQPVDARTVKTTSEWPAGTSPADFISVGRTMHVAPLDGYRTVDVQMKGSPIGFGFDILERREGRSGSSAGLRARGGDGQSEHP